MKIRTVVAGFSLLVAGLIGGALLAGQLYKATDLPTPTGASKTLQQAIVDAGKPDIALKKLLVPQSADQWRSAIALRAESQTVSLDELASDLNLTITRDMIAGVAVHRVVPNDVVLGKGLFIYVHGGAYVFGGGDASVGEGVLIAARSGITAISIDYRMPPDDPHPAAVTDLEMVYRALLETHDATNIGMGGTSAGGGLSMAAVHHFKALGLPIPGALYLGTPWADLTKTGDTMFTLEGIDRVLVTYDGILEAAALLYADGEDLKDPLLSPVYGDLAGFPATYLVTGTRDMFLSDTVRVHRKLRNSGVEADLNVYEGLSHAEYAFVAGSPEHEATYRELAEFLRRHLK
jgi:acetyl esterase/lipase